MSAKLSSFGFSGTARAVLFLFALILCQSPASADIINANATANNGGSPGWAIFFDLTANTMPVSVTSMTTASTAAANAPFSIEIFTRTGTALGGPVTGGPGSSPDGWTSLGTAMATQGPTSSGISLPIDIPAINVDPFATVGVAVLFTGAGPRYFGTGSGPYQMFSDSNLTLTTGDSRSVPFTPTGSWFAPRGLTGSITYAVVPEPSSFVLLTLFGPLLWLRRRRS